jgi:hypothetical protein
MAASPDLGVHLLWRWLSRHLRVRRERDQFAVNPPSCQHCYAHKRTQERPRISSVVRLAGRKKSLPQHPVAPGPRSIPQPQDGRPRAGPAQVNPNGR